MHRRSRESGCRTKRFQLIVVIGNAAITGVLSTVDDRYQARVIWLASFCLETPIFKKMFRAQQRFQGVGESRLVFKGVAQTIFVAGSGIERKTTLDVNLH